MNLEVQQIIQQQHSKQKMVYHFNGCGFQFLHFSTSLMTQFLSPVTSPFQL